MLPSCTLAGYDFLGWYDEEGALYEKIDELNIGDPVAHGALPPRRADI